MSSGQATENNGWDLLKGGYIVLETYRRNGVGVKTTVWFVKNGGVIYVRTGTRTGKVKRLRRNPQLKLARSNGRGTPQGTWFDAIAAVVTGQERQDSLELMRRKYGLQWRLVGLLHKLRGTPEYTILAIRSDSYSR